MQCSCSLKAKVAGAVLFWQLCVLPSHWVRSLTCPAPFLMALKFANSVLEFFLTLLSYFMAPSIELVIFTATSSFISWGAWFICFYCLPEGLMCYVSKILSCLRTSACCPYSETNMSGCNIFWYIIIVLPSRYHRLS